MDEWTLNDLLECSVCLERLDPSSKVLPCQHTFCKKCLVDISETQKELRCPECRVLIECGIDELPPNVLLMRILESMKNSYKQHPKGNSPLPVPQSSKHHHQHSQQPRQAPSNSGPKPEQSSVEPQAAIPEHPCARAKFTFASPKAGDLNFKKGDMILLRKKVDANWYHGECNGNKGVFPAVYVDVLTPLPAPVPQCKALYDFKMNSEEEEGCLTFKKGDILTVIRRVDENWAEGRIGPKIGIFPLAFVDMNHVARSLMKLPLNPSTPPAPSKAAPLTPVGRAALPTPESHAHNSSHGDTSAFQLPAPSISPQHSDQQSSLTPRTAAISLQTKAKRQSLNLSQPSSTSDSVPPLPPANDVSTKPPADTEKIHRSRGSSKKLYSDHRRNLNLPAVYVALYPYKPQKADELELEKGVLYNVTEICQDGWFKGTSRTTNKSGVFPGNYVSLPKTPGANGPGNQSSPHPSNKTKHSRPQVPAKMGSNTDPSGTVTARPAQIKNSATSPLEPHNVQSNACVPPGPPPRSTSPSSHIHGLSSNLWHSPAKPSLCSPEVMERTVSTTVAPSNISPLRNQTPVEKIRDKKSLGSGLMRRLVTIKNSKSPPASAFSIDNPVFEDNTRSANLLNDESPAIVESVASIHSRSSSLCDSNGMPTTPMPSGHRKSNSLDSTSAEKVKKNKALYPPVRERFRCIVPYPPNGEYELALEVGDIIYVHKKRDDGWFRGTQERTGRTGLFPGSFVEGF
ncbi:E3 ubiquitin-protein ligase SH3RF3 [Neocloeon triangulifer]|uniref:E3 ubiquitin-protein ligase SH3RF3 n=1 Tax=Neocloeon triangulifer TaxID=2078957 RepID=UPI00286ECCCD|nr:E3 ubiquitin-protein ligase SH3RF3 [Neocloeon triangulifer]